MKRIDSQLHIIASAAVRVDDKCWSWYTLVGVKVNVLRIVRACIAYYYVWRREAFVALKRD